MKNWKKVKKQTQKQKQKNNFLFLFIGLGNPGREYHETRHNAGFMVIDNLAEIFSLKFRKPLFKNYFIATGDYHNKQVVLIKPMTFMNRSGLIFNYIPDKYFHNNTKMVVICDNMDLPTGTCRIKNNGSNSGHNGISSIINGFGSENYLRIYVGISRPVKGESVISHVLGEFDESENLDFKSGIDKAGNAAVSLLTTDVQGVMNEYNRRNT